MSLETCKMLLLWCMCLDTSLIVSGILFPFVIFFLQLSSLIMIKYTEGWILWNNCRSLTLLEMGTLLFSPLGAASMMMPNIWNLFALNIVDWFGNWCPSIIGVNYRSHIKCQVLCGMINDLKSCNGNSWFEWGELSILNGPFR